MKGKINNKDFLTSDFTNNICICIKFSNLVCQKLPRLLKRPGRVIFLLHEQQFPMIKIHKNISVLFLFLFSFMDLKLVWTYFQ